MRLATSMNPTIPAPPAPSAGLRPDEIRLIRDASGERVERGSDVPSSADFSPGSKVWSKYGRYLLDLPGAVFVSTGTKTPTEVRTEFEAPEMAALARNALSDSVDGVTLLVTAPDRPLPPTPGAPYAWNWWDNPSNIARAIGGVRGVVMTWRGASGAQMYCESQEYADLLRPLFRQQMPGGGYLAFIKWSHGPSSSKPPLVG